MMLKKTLILLILSTAVLFAQIDDLMFSANENYQNEQYEDAINVYKEIISRGYFSEVLYYNLGNAHFRLNELGKAILYYEKGLKISPNDEDLQYNLSIAKARTVDRIKDVPKLFLLEWWELLLSSLSISGWAIIVSVIFSTLLISIAVYLTGKTGKSQRLGFLLGSSSLAVLLLFTIILFSAVNREQSTDYGVLIEIEIAAKQSPDERSNDAFIIHEGLKFEVEDQVNNWSRIRLSDGKVGWLPDYSFEII
jgi:tetratricopeptide (TPR) repeat protein